ncbi:MAG: small-conductance mechanosensitive ion channel [Chloroflexi bacterium]|nr:MAG: small-conductance mechanosensitive ion channel [Chloroflexota bacterium]
MPVVSDLGTAIATSLAAALAVFFAAIPKLVAFVLILVVGWIIASLIAGAVRGILRFLRLDAAAGRFGATGFLTRAGVNRQPSHVVAEVVKWVVRIAFIAVAFDALGLPAVSEAARALLLFIPNLLVALVILAIAGVAASFVAGFVRAASAGSGIANGEMLARVASGAIVVFGILIALNQLGIATTFVNAIFIGLVAAMALAFGLAFGLGGREVAGRILETWSPATPGSVTTPGRATQSTGNGRPTGTVERARTTAE